VELVTVVVYAECYYCSQVLDVSRE